MKKDKLGRDIFWNKRKTKWKQPPVPIKVGDLVDIEYRGDSVLGRYIGRGKGVAIVSTPDKELVEGYVCGRGFDRNPELISDEQLLNLLED